MEIVDTDGLPLTASTQTSSHLRTEVVDPQAVLHGAGDFVFHVREFRCLWFCGFALGVITGVAQFESVFNLFVTFLTTFH
jgi:hypothetical protein